MFFFPFYAFSQQRDNAQGSPESKSIFRVVFDKNRPKYIDVGLGMSHVLYQDLATSPLYYKGWIPAFFVSRSAIGEDAEFDLRLWGSTNMFEIPGLELNSESKYVASSSFGGVGLSYGALFQIKKISLSRLNFKLGGILNSDFSGRLNEYLGNNSVGIDVFVGVFASAKWTYYFGDWFPSTFFLKSLFSNKSYVSYRLDVPVYWANIRTRSYVYAYDHSLQSSENSLEGLALVNYGGYQLRSRIDYAFPVKSRNGNVYGISYLWAMYRTAHGGFPEGFSLGTNTLMLSLMFNL